MGSAGRPLTSIGTFLPLAGANSQRFKVFEAVGGPPEACRRLLGPPGLTSDQGSGMRGHRGPGSRVELRLRRGVREGSGAKAPQRALGAGPVALEPAHPVFEERASRQPCFARSDSALEHAIFSCAQVRSMVGSTAQCIVRPGAFASVCLSCAVCLEIV